MLQCLAQRPGRLVTKDELYNAVWPGVFVGDAALKVCVLEIRRALADDAKAPRFIETVHRRGYRFIAPVAPEHESPPAPALASPAPPAVEIRHRSKRSLRRKRTTRRSGDVNIAYQVVGDGPLDLVFVMGWVSHLEYFWNEPSFARFLSRLASFSRLILFDKRGTGLSDRVTALPTLEAAHGRRARGDGSGGLGARGAARRVRGRTDVRAVRRDLPGEDGGAGDDRHLRASASGTPDYPWAPTRRRAGRFFDEIRDALGRPGRPRRARAERGRRSGVPRVVGTYLRMGASPGAALRLTQMNAEIDVRHVLPPIRVPTLVLHRTDDRCLPVEEGRYVAERIPGAKFVELPGDDHLPFVGDQDAMLDEIEEFLTGSRHGIEPDRVLATVL